MTLQIGLFLFDEVEVLDFAGPFEVFSTATRVHLRQHPGTEPPFEVHTVARDTRPVLARAGLAVQARHTLATAPAFDVLLVPGGVVDAELQRADVIDWIAQRSRTAQLVASVCTGAFLLARAGVLAGRTVTTHWEDVAALREELGAAQVVDDVRYVDHGSLVTSAGISAGLDMSLHLVARLASPGLARATARQMDYAWEETR
ncbi:DJ-1/PfpI family protein [Caldimonas brevitalea]|uniref:Thiamine biosynthesis protein ThiJ n=1 Tax=Caldimonas brevitalea TaxID=413882 RepID=A0A0G3BPQ8_9BURK|nr:DJ-1/PfpI family protein [Caldimonas brevitalea]AKJ31397.1 thiamine biosynthesis protein ThiJ [Caldimonas brevitalea]